MERPALQTVIKWPGSKRRVAPLLAALLPPGARYYEPFVGSGALLPFRPCREGVAGDVIGALIALWEMIRDAPEQTATEYAFRWKRLQEEGHTVYYDIRASFNETRDPHDFLFLTRTCVNGLIRFNASGAFNNSLHHTRPGIAPHRLRQIILRWSRAVAGVRFRCADYRETLASATQNDVAFLDPPYGGTRGRYLPEPFALPDLYDELDRLNRIGAKWLLTFDGQAGARRYAAGPPPDLYTTRFGIPTGHAPFTRLMKASVEQVIETVYLNFEPSDDAVATLARYRRDHAAQASLPPDAHRAAQLPGSDL